MGFICLNGLAAHSLTERSEPNAARSLASIARALIARSGAERGKFPERWVAERALKKAL